MSLCIKEIHPADPSNKSVYRSIGCTKYFEVFVICFIAFLISVLKRISYKISTLHFLHPIILIIFYFSFKNFKYGKLFNPSDRLTFFFMFSSKKGWFSHAKKLSCEGNENKSMNNFIIHFLYNFQLSKIHPADLLIKKETYVCVALVP